MFKKKRKLKAKFSIDVGDDFFVEKEKIKINDNEYEFDPRTPIDWGVDFSSKMVNLMASEMQKEIDRQVLSDLMEAAKK